MMSRDEINRRLAYEDAAAWAQNALCNSDWVMIATETTGLHRSAEIVELVALNHLGETLFETLVRPQGTIHPEAIAMHGITNDMVRHAPAFPKIAPALFDALEHRRIIGYNVAFETRMLRQCAERHGLLFEVGPAECLMAAYARFWGECQANGKAFRRQTLKDACEQQSIPWFTHRAGPKCRAEFALLTTMATNSSTCYLAGRSSRVASLALAV